MEERLFLEAEILTEAAQINGMIVAFVEVRADDFRLFEEDESRRRLWSSVSSVATSESLAEISFRSGVRNGCLSLVYCRVYCDVDAQSKVVALTEMGLI